MTDLPESSQDQTGKHAPSAMPEAKGRLGRRFILTGMPFAMTLANRPALATGGQCTMSLLASLTNSHPLNSDLNCGVSPGCWKNHALDCTNTWESLQSAGISTGQTFRALFAMPDHWKLVNSGGTVVEATLVQALSYSYRFKFCGPVSGSSDDFITTDSGCPKHILAGYLNSIAFNGGLVVNGVHVIGHYPVTPTAVAMQVAALFGLTKMGGESQGAFASRVNGALSDVKNFAYQVGPDSQHYCDVDL